MRLHFGKSVLDPDSLGSTKKEIKRRADLSKWKPTPTELETFATEFVQDFTEAKNIEQAKNIEDNYYAHSQYFIRDALIFCVFEHAVAFADAGIVLPPVFTIMPECIEILLQRKYELSLEMQAANFWAKGRGKRFHTFARARSVARRARVCSCQSNHDFETSQHKKYTADSESSREAYRAEDTLMNKRKLKRIHRERGDMTAVLEWELGRKYS
ncbi:hypothetical protein DFH08DRAFT_823784 [Mycena albidolilacea]|uniref:DUF6589 domain-containing protein n=1 Tax=Mycena albidolilacea TaxID=1033008 RepID=A0AAD6Z6P7_9AGAR|nr:hypothetical protein DFH08DRAFT_823784 [Mycena albidolilacea]